jgi:hypothetical protein
MTQKKLGDETKSRHEPKVSEEIRSIYEHKRPRARTNNTKSHNDHVVAIMTILLTLDYAADHIDMAIKACAGTNKTAPIEIGDVLQKLWPYYYDLLTMPMAAEVPIQLAPSPLQLNSNNDRERVDLAKCVLPQNTQVPTPENDADDDTALDVGPGMTHHGMQESLNQPINTKLLNDYKNLLQKVICNNCWKAPANALFIPCRCNISRSTT